MVAAAKAGGALVAVDVLRPGSPRDFGRLAGLLASADWFAPNSDQLAALTGEDDSARPSTRCSRSAPAASR